MRFFSRVFFLLSIVYGLGVLGYIFYSQQSVVNAAVDNSNVVISQIQIAGVGSSSAQQDFVELYNPTSAAISLGDYKLVSRTKNGAMDNSVVDTFSAGDMIAAHSYYLWCNSSLESSLNCDKVSSDTVSDNNSFAIRNKTTGAVIDAVTIGAPLNSLGEGAIPATPSAGQSIIRKATASSTAETLVAGGGEGSAGNGYDTDDNAADFVLLSASMPRNSASPAANPIELEPTVTVLPMVSIEPSVIPSLIPTTEPTVMPTETPAPTVTVLPTVTMMPTETPTLTPTLSVVPISILPSVSEAPVPTSVVPTSKPGETIVVDEEISPRMRLVCRQTERVINIWGHRVIVPDISCRVIRVYDKNRHHGERGRHTHHHHSFFHH